MHNPTPNAYFPETPKTTAPPIFELRAWVTLDKPTLCEIWNVNKNDVTIRDVKNDEFFFVDRTDIHSVHIASIATDQVVLFLGEPPC